MTAKILNATKALFIVVFPFLEFGEIIIAFSNAWLIFYASTLVPAILCISFFDVIVRNPTIFFNSYQLLEPKLHKAINENPS